MRGISEAEVINYINGEAWGVRGDGRPIYLGTSELVEMVVVAGNPISGEVGEVIELERKLRNQPKILTDKKSAKMVEAGRKAALTRKFNAEQRAK